jgi:2-methylisocitrate lyase-like PEP mutase family enzyme
MQETDVATTAARADALRKLQAPGQFLVMPNAWDAASARIFAKAGFAAIATTSGGVAQAVGYQDHEDAPAEEMIAAAARITRSVDIPVTVDFEAGYGLPAEEVAQRLVAIGAAGMNIEDTDHHSDAPLVEAEAHAQRLADIKAAARAAGADLVLNARVDSFIQRVGTREEQLAEAIRRGKLYLEAGADSIYPIVVFDEEILSALVEALGPINAMMIRGRSPSLERLKEIGVRRVTYATSIFRELYTQLEEIAPGLALAE